MATKTLSNKQYRIKRILQLFERGELQDYSGNIVRNRRKALALAFDEVGVKRKKRKHRRKK